MFGIPWSSATKTGSPYGTVGPFPSVSSIGTLWLAPPSVARTSANWVVASDGASFTDYNAPTAGADFFLCFGGAPKHTFNANGLQIGNGSATDFGGAVNAVGLEPGTAAAANPAGAVFWVDSTTLAFTVRSSGGAVEEVAPAGTGAVNTQKMKRHRVRAAVTTTLAGGAQVAYTYTIPATTEGRIKVEWTAKDTNTIGNSAHGEVVAGFYNSAGAATLIGAAQALYATQGGSGGAPTVSFNPTGATVQIKVSTVGADSWDWQLDITINEN